MEENSDELVEAAKTAVQLEKDGNKFYKEAAEKAKNPHARKLFERLAEEETYHLGIFEKLVEQVAGAMDWPTILKEAPVRRAPIFPTELKTKDEEKADIGERDSVRRALEFEYNALDFFLTEAERAKHPVVREIFKRIADEERNHVNFLEAELDYVTKTGYWFDINELQLDGMY